jgi:hypothetical protein
MFRKVLTIGIILLFLGVAVQSTFAEVSIESDNSEMEEITIQFYETDRTYNHTVMLTQEKVKELEKLINNFETELKDIDNPVDTETLYKKTIVSFKELGILPNGMSIDYIQQLVIGNERNEIISKIIERWFNRKKEVLDENENLLCLISGNTINTIIAGSVPFLFSIHCISFWIRHIAFLAILKEDFHDLWIWWTQNFGDLHYNFLSLRTAFLVYLGAVINFLPIKLGALMLYGNIRAGYMGYFYTIPAEGWVYTVGSSGNKSWEGSFYGGVVGFTGIKIIYGLFSFFYLGAAYKVHVEYD